MEELLLLSDSAWQSSKAYDVQAVKRCNGFVPVVYECLDLPTSDHLQGRFGPKALAMIIGNNFVFDSNVHVFFQDLHWRTNMHSKP